MEVNNMYVEPVRGMSAAQTKQTVQMTTDTDNTIHAQSTEGEAEYTSYDSTTPKTSASQTMTAEEMQSAENEKLKKAIERMNEQLPNSEAKFGIHEAKEHGNCRSSLRPEIIRLAFTWEGNTYVRFIKNDRYVLRNGYREHRIPVSQDQEYQGNQFKERTEEAGVEADRMAGLKLQDLQYVQ